MMERVRVRISPHWVCFDCRKQFRQRLSGLLMPREPERTHACPECKRAMVDMGRYFCPPARRKLREWEELRRIADHGYRFTGEGSVAWVQFVVSWSTGRLDADRLIHNCSCQERTEGQRLLNRIRQRYDHSRSAA